MKKKMTIWLLALLLLLSGCGAAEGTESALPDSPDGIVSEEVVQQPSLFDMTATGFPSSDGSNTRSQET